MLIYPYYGFILIGTGLAVFFLAIFISKRQLFPLVCSALWLVPAGYEAWVISNCTGECNIRVDLLVIFPLEALILIPISVVAWKAHKRHEKSQA